MKVITPYGFGEVTGQNFQRFLVKLDTPFLDKGEMWLEKFSEVFPFGLKAVVRVINVAPEGWFSNIQLLTSWWGAKDYLNTSTVVNETTFFVNLRTGELEVNRELGLLSQHVLELRPWLDRWAIEHSQTFEDVSSAIGAFGKTREEMLGAEGINASILLNIEERKLLWFYLTVAPPLGVIFEKKFV